MVKRKEPARAGFSRRDALALIGGFVLVIGLLAVAVMAVQKPSDQNWSSTANKNNLRQLANAVIYSHDQNKTISPYFGMYGGKLTGTFHYHLLPFIENTPVWNAPDPNAVITPFLASNDPTLRNPPAGATNYVVNMRLFYSEGGLGELQEGPKLIKLKWGQVIDGTSQTLLFATKYHTCGNGGSLWYDPAHNSPNSPTAATFGVSMNLWQRAPTQAACDPLAGTAVSFNPDYMLVVFCDASVHTVSTSISPATWQALHTYAGKDVVGETGID
ncbi:MAG TPA: hypothetical protein VE988_22465 [Gemmataceae bacterium]|nr:hypothetical protein [Gemmataceae bacterium]